MSQRRRGNLSLKAGFHKYSLGGEETSSFPVTATATDNKTATTMASGALSPAINMQLRNPLSKSNNVSRGMGQMLTVEPASSGFGINISSSRAT